MVAELIVIPFSHFCEKARWGLEHGGVRFRERKVLPALHQLAVRWALRGTDAGSADRHSSRYSTPVLVTDEGPISGSTAILRHGAPALFGGAEIDAWIERFDDVLGPHARRMAYFFVFETPGVIGELAAANTGPIQTALLRLGEKRIVPRMRKAMRIDREGFERSHGAVQRILDEVADAIDDGRPYLTGGRFTAADLTFAALLAPLLLPPAYGAVMPGPERFDHETQELIRTTREHPAGAFALELYRRHR